MAVQECALFKGACIARSNGALDASVVGLGECAVPRAPRHV